MVLENEDGFQVLSELQSTERLSSIFLDMWKLSGRTITCTFKHKYFPGTEKVPIPHPTDTIRPIFAHGGANLRRRELVLLQSFEYFWNGTRLKAGIEVKILIYVVADWRMP